MTVSNAAPQMPTTLITVDLNNLPTGIGEHYALIKGNLTSIKIAKPIPGFVTHRIATILDAYNVKTNFGTQFTAETGFKVRNDNHSIRTADIAFISVRRFSVNELEDLNEDYLSIAPDLVVEVVSHDDRASEIAQKTQEWLNFGVLMVWNVYPETQQVYRHTADEVHVFKVEDTLDGGDALPDFQVAIKTFFSKRK